MKDQELERLNIQIIAETNQVRQWIEILEISKNSIMRSKYCKKNGMSYTQFCQKGEEAKANIINYPFYLNAAEGFIRKINKEEKYRKILDELIIKFRSMMEQQKKKTYGADEMEGFLKGLKNEKNS